MLRIVSGRHKGKVLAQNVSPSVLSSVRPSGQGHRLQLLNLLAHSPWMPRLDWQETVVLDVFAGFGTLGLEALSQGAKYAVFLEKDPRCVKIIQSNLAGLDEEENASVFLCDALHPPQAASSQASLQASLVFLDPPYGQGLAQKALPALQKRGWLKTDALIIAETGKQEELTPPLGFVLLESRKWRSSRLTFFRTSG